MPILTGFSMLSTLFNILFKKLDFVFRYILAMFFNTLFS